LGEVSTVWYGLNLNKDLRADVRVFGVFTYVRPPRKLSKAMTVAELVDEEVMTHLALHGCVRGMDPYAQHLLKTSDHPIFKFRRAWMRSTALQQHLEAEARQAKITNEFKQEPVRRGAAVRRRTVLDPHLMAEMEHYNGMPITEQLSEIKAEAPALFPRREVNGG
jgi:hypothetical protein